MSVRSLDADGDWNFGKGRNDYLYRTDAVVQNISTRLKSFLGDCFFALDEGVDWFTLLGSKNRVALELNVRAVILNTPEVTGIVSSETNFDARTRNLTLTYTVTTIYSAEPIVGEVTGISSFILTENGDILTTESGAGISAG